MPLQAREVLEDLRLGRLSVRAVDPALPIAADRLGRRVFSGMVVASATIGGAIAAAHSKELAAGLLVFAAVVLVFHFLRDVRRASKDA